VDRLIRWFEIGVIAFIAVFAINKALDMAGLPQFKA